MLQPTFPLQPTDHVSRVARLRSQLRTPVNHAVNCVDCAVTVIHHVTTRCTACRAGCAGPGADGKCTGCYMPKVCGDDGIENPVCNPFCLLSSDMRDRRERCVKETACMCVCNVSK